MEFVATCRIEPHDVVKVSDCGDDSDDLYVSCRQNHVNSLFRLTQKDAIDLAQAILKHYEVLQPDPERDEIVDEGDEMPEEAALNAQHEIEDFGTW